MAIIDMQTMRYINMLDRTSRVKTTKCFAYNNTIIFAVPREMISRALGPNASNIKKIQDVLGKKVRIIEEPTDISEARKFVEDVVAPTTFKSLEIKNNEIIISAGGTQAKANLLGRNKKRFEELKKILFNVFGFELKVV